MNFRSKMCLAIVLAAFIAGASWAQTPTVAAQGTLKDHGRPLAGAQIVLTNGDSAKTYEATADQDGAFEINGVAPGSNYKVEVFNASGQMVFSYSTIAFNPESNTPVVLTIDTSDASKTNLGAGARSHYTRDQIAALKARKDKAQAENALITQAIAAMNGKRWQEALAPLQQLVADNPGRYEFYQPLGDVQFNLGQYNAAIQSLEKGIRLADSTTIKPANPATDPIKKKAHVVSMLMTEGNSFLKLAKSKEAIDAFSRATKADPTSELAYFNLCATLYNVQQPEAALPACNKAISLDPKHANSYFVKGALLMQKSKRDSSGNLQALPGTAAALRKYLQLEPDGPHAAQAKSMLAQIAAKAGQAGPETKKR